MGPALSRAMGQVPAPIPLEVAGEAEHVRAVLRGWAAAALPGQGGASAGLQRTVLRCLLDMGLKQRGGGGYELQAVLVAQLGEKLKQAVAADPSLRTALNTPGNTVAALLDSLSRQSIVSTAVTGPTRSVKYACVQQEWAAQQAGAAPAPAALPQPQQLPLPIPLTLSSPEPAQLPLPAALPAQTGTAAQASDGGATSRPPASVAAALATEYDAQDCPALSGASSASGAIYQLGCAARRAITGGSTKSRLQMFALGALARMAVQHVGGTRFRVQPVTAAAAGRFMTNRFQPNKSPDGPAMLECYQQQFGGSLLALVRDQACSRFVRVQRVGAEDYVLLLLDQLAGRVAPKPPAGPTGVQQPSRGTSGGSTGSTAAKAAGSEPSRYVLVQPRQAKAAPGSVAPPPPPPLRAAVQVAAAPNGAVVGSGARAASSGPSTPEVTSQLAGLQLGSGPNGAVRAATPTVPVLLNGSSGSLAGAASPAALPQAQFVSSAAEAAAAVDMLLTAPEVAVDCEGDLERAGAIALIQLYAPGLPGPGPNQQRCFLFDLHGMAEGERDQAACQLARLLESTDTVKVLHDCRSDCEALFYQHGIRVNAVWDTQVAFGLLQFVSSLGAGAGPDGVNAPIGLNQLLQQYELPPNPLKKAMHARMDREPDLWTRRPMQEDVVQYAVADVWQLLQAKALLEADLGPAAAAQLDTLSTAYSEWRLDPADRRSCAGAGSGGGYAGAVRLALGKDMQLTIEAADGYRPRYSPALVEGEGSDAEGDATSAAEPAPAQQSTAAADDPDTQLILELFPGHVRAAILAALAAEEAAAAAADVGAGTPAADGAEEEDGASAAAAAGAAQGAGSASGSAADAGSGGSVVASGGVQLVEVIVDLGRPVFVRLSSRTELKLDVEFGVEDALAYLADAKGHVHLGDGTHSDLFYSDNRAGIPGTLHRISAMRDREGGIIGLTYRVGRHVPGVGRLILDVLSALSQGHDATGHEAQGAVSPSLLLLGGPGTGKTTLLRDVANVLSETFRQQVVVVDTSNEVAGDGTVPHECIGRARRMMVRDRRCQHETMVEAVQNHNPDVVIVDEIGTAKEVTAAKSIAHRGVVLVGTAHGRSLDALMRNGELNGLIGGLHSVTVGDAEAKSSNGKKTRTERQGEPAFSTLVEVLSRNRWRVHMSVARSVDAILAGSEPTTQLRWVQPDGRMMVRLEGAPAGAGGGGGMHAAVAEAAGRLGGKGRWFQGLLELAAQG